jgi:drug/metabolite transporter (DMT)-like permease
MRFSGHGVPLCRLGCVLLAVFTIIIERIKPMLDALWWAAYMYLGVIVLIPLDFVNWTLWTSGWSVLVLDIVLL